MKMMRVILTCILACSFFNLIDANCKEYVQASILHKRLQKRAKHQEGLAEYTKIKVGQNLYRSIDEVSIGDMIYSPEMKSYQEIILKEQFFVPHSFEIKTQNCTIQAAPAQLFYDDLTQEWVEAQNITVENSIGESLVESITKIDKYCSVRKLNVSNHVFTIEHDKLLAHNSALVVAAELIVGLNELVLYLPVLVEIGLTVSSKKMWDHFYEIWELEKNKESDYIYKHYITKLVEKTRFYYKERRQALLDLLQKYKKMQQVVSTISERSSIDLGVLNPYIQNQSHSFPLLPSIGFEINCSDPDRQKLLGLRDKELFDIEQEINQIHLALGIYLDEILTHQACLESYTRSLISEFQQSCLDYKSAIQASYGSNNFSIVESFVINQYRLVVSIDICMHHMIKRSEEWALIFQIYFNEPTGLLFRQSSNIIESLDGETVQAFMSMPEDLKNQLSIVQSYYEICSRGLNRHRISLSQNHVQSFIDTAQIAMKKADDQNCQNVDIKKSMIKHAVPPNDPDPDDDNDKKKKLPHEEHPHDDSKNDLHENENKRSHQFRKKEGHLNGQTPKNLKRIRDLIRNRKNRIDLDKDGNMWYAKKCKDGQLWATVRIKDSRVQNCGVNKIPRTVRPGFGLNNPKPVQKGK